jgi:hypothetical protein
MKFEKLALTLTIALCSPATSQVNSQEPSDSLQVQSEALRVFMDCTSDYCDFDHFRREITFVNHVRDRRDSQVHVLITTLETASGGQEFTITYIGREEFDTINDSLVYFSSESDTYDEVRAGLTRTIKLGLVRYVIRTQTAGQLDVSYQAPETKDLKPQTPVDPWDYWIYRIKVGGDLSGEERQRSLSSEVSLSANRTTENWKIRLFLTGWYNEDEFEFADGSKLTSIERDHSVGTFTAKSLDEHWSVGANAEAQTSSFKNYDLALEFGPTIEYNLFPYSESTYRELTFSYRVELKYFDYEELTIFDETIERRGSNSLEISYSLKQPFGTINTSLETSAFLGDFSQHSLELSGWMDIRLVRGLDLNLSGSVERIKDQIFLPRGGATDEEVLLRRQELGTDYRYSASISLSYTFGSIYNNIVNPRFE